MNSRFHRTHSTGLFQRPRFQALNVDAQPGAGLFEITITGELRGDGSLTKPRSRRTGIRWGQAKTYTGETLIKQGTSSLDSSGLSRFINIAAPPALVGGKFAITNGIAAPHQFFHLIK